MSTATLPLSTVETVRLDITNNWTGQDELPFEQVAERVLQIEAHNEAGEAEHGTLTVSFGKPVFLDGMGWACPFRMAGMGRVHVSPARGIDAVEAMQAAFAQVGKQLAGMGRRHKITFGGGEDLGFLAPEGQSMKAAGAGCPVMNGTLSL